jgi:hypothetical protein
MTKRLIPLLTLTILLATAPAAMAACFKCGRDPSTCVQVTVGQGWTTCEPGLNDEPCIYGGPACYPGGGFAPEPFDAEFEVAAVERLDEPQPTAPETRVAALELPRTTPIAR